MYFVVAKPSHAVRKVEKRDNHLESLNLKHAHAPETHPTRRTKIVC
jgi:hypothetical protein